jgi:integrase
MHKLWKHPNGNYYALHGPRLRKRASLGTKDSKAAEIRFAHFVIESRAQLPDSPLVGDILDVYEKSRLANGSNTGETLRAPNALKHSVKALKKQLGDLKPEHLNPDTMTKFARERGASNGTILRDVGVLRAALAHTIKKDQRPEIANPVPKPSGRKRWLTRAEVYTLIPACHVPHLRLFVILGIHTGARSGALLELKWEQVDFEAGLVDLGEGHGNKRRAIVPMNDDLRRALVAAKEMACTDYVVEYGGRQVGTIKNGFAAACRRAKIKDATPHVLRHTCATWLVMARITYEEIGKMLGDTKATIEKTYGHHHPDYLKNASKALERSAA